LIIPADKYYKLNLLAMLRQGMGDIHYTDEDYDNVFGYCACGEGLKKIKDHK